jgi:hypothetical protein
MDIITIPSAFYEMLFNDNIEVPQVEEIRRVGKGRQYDLDQNDPHLKTLIVAADVALASDDAVRKNAAINTLRALRRQGVKMELSNTMPNQNARRWVWTKTDAVAGNECGKYRGRKLLHGIDRATGTLAIRIAGTRKVYHSDLSGLLVRCVKIEANRIIKEKQAARLARRKERRGK